MSYKMFVEALEGRAGLKITKSNPNYIVGGILGVGGLFITSRCFFNVRPGQKAIMFNRTTGIQEDLVYDAGLHFKVPWFQRPILFNVRTEPFEYKAETGSKDLQEISIELRVLVRPDTTQLQTVYRRLGVDFAAVVLPSLVEETLRSVVAQYDAAQLLTQREIVSYNIRSNLKMLLKEYNLVLDDVSITCLKFSSEFDKAIERKQIAQQEAEKAKFTVDRAKEEAKSVILQAEAEAMATTLIGKACKTNPAYLKLKKIETRRKVAGILGKSNNKIMVDGRVILMADDDLEAVSKKH